MATKMSTKSVKRLESKKRKAEAFLNLIKCEQNEVFEEASSDKIQVPTIGSTPDVSPEKKVKLEKDSPDSKPDSSVASGDREDSGEGKPVAGPAGTEAEEGKLVAGTPGTWDAANNRPYRTEEMLAEYKKALKARQKRAMERPKIFLTLDELTRDFPNDIVTDEVKQPPPLFITDVQNLLLYSVQGVHASYKPRWCQLLRRQMVSKVITVVLDSLGKEEFEQYADYLPTLKSAFDVQVSLVSPIQYGSSVREELLNVPFSLRFLQTKFPDMELKKFHEIKRNLKQHGSVNKGTLITPANSNDGTSKTGEGNQAKPVVNTECKFDRRLLMLSPEQMIREGIPMPHDLNDERYKGFLYSKSGQYKPVTSTSPLLAVDCEMVQTTESRMDLARVSIINENLETVYDSYVKPKAKVVNYVTRYSGITKDILASVTTTVEDVQQKLDSLLPPDAILCGQSIGGDLRSMKIFHPYVIDTSVIYNLTGNRDRKTGLKKLAENFLSKSIQEDNGKGHSSVEDATATMELVQLKLKNDITFGDYIMSSLANPEEQMSMTPENTSFTKDSKVDSEDQNAMKKRRLFFQHERQKYSESLFARIARQNKTGVVIDEEESKSRYPDDVCVLPCASDKQREKQTSQSCGEVDFCLSTLYGYRDFLSSCSQDHSPTEEEKQQCLWKLDRRLWKILRTAPARSMFAVILTGREHDNQLTHAMTFAKIV